MKEQENIRERLAKEIYTANGAIPEIVYKVVDFILSPQCLKIINEKQEQEIKISLYNEFKKYILYVGDDILEKNMTAKDFWKKMKLQALSL